MCISPAAMHMHYHQCASVHRCHSLYTHHFLPHALPLQEFCKAAARLRVLRVQAGMPVTALPHQCCSPRCPAYGSSRAAFTHMLKCHTLRPSWRSPTLSACSLEGTMISHCASGHLRQGKEAHFILKRICSENLCWECSPCTCFRKSSGHVATPHAAVAPHGAR